MTRTINDLGSQVASRYPFQSKFANVNGWRMHYIDEGPPDASPVLLLHGNPTWGYLWRDTVRRGRCDQVTTAGMPVPCGPRIPLPPLKTTISAPSRTVAVQDSGRGGNMDAASTMLPARHGHERFRISGPAMITC